MKNISVTALMFLVMLPALVFAKIASPAQNGCWRFNEGGGNVLFESGKSGVNGQVIGKNYHWGSEDDRGIFLLFDGKGTGYARFDSAPVFTPEKDFYIKLRFSCDLNTISGKVFLLNKEGAYNIAVDRNGYLVISFPGNHISISSPDLKIASNIDNELEIIGDGKNISVRLNGGKDVIRKMEGIVCRNDNALEIGGSPGQYYKSNWYLLQFDKTAPGQVPRAGNGVKPQSDPPGTVFFYDFASMEPRSAFAVYTYKVDKWVLRKSPMLENQTHILHPPGMGGEDIVYDPHLKGHYDLYVGMRVVDTAGQIQVQLSGMKDFYTISVPPGGSKHFNCRIRLDENIDMTGKKIILHSVGDRVYFDYIKLIPSSASVKYQIQEGVFPVVTREKRKFPKERVAERLRSDAKYRERFYIDDKALPSPSQTSLRNGYLLYPVNWMDLIFPNSIPVSDPASPVLEMAAAQGEYEPGAFCIRTLCDLNGFSVKIGAMRNGSHVLPPESLKIGIVRNLKRRTVACYGASEYMDGPQYIERNIPGKLPANLTTEFWLTVHVPTDAVPGVYSGNIEVNTGCQTRNLPLRVKVYPFRLDRLYGYDIGMSTGMQSIGFADFRQEVEDLRAHGMTSLFLQEGISGDYFEITGDKPENVRVDFEKSRLFPILEKIKAEGFEGNIRVQCGFIFRFCMKFLPNENAFNNALDSILNQVEQYRKEKGYNPIHYQLYDEVVSYPHMLESYYQGIQLLKKSKITVLSTHMWKKTSRPYSAEVARCYPFIDIFSLRYNSRNLWYVDSWEEIEDTCEHDGKRLLAYNSNNAITFTQPATMRYMVGWFFRTAGRKTKGHNTWCYQWPNGNPYEDFDSSGSDWMYHYPPFPQEGIAGGPALNWESMREGVDDLRYVVTLENLIRQCSAGGLKAEAESGKKLLKKLCKSFDLEQMQTRCIFLEQKWEHSGTLPDDRLFAKGDFYLPNGWKPSDYDSGRSAIAAKIVELRNALAKKQ